MSGLGVDTSTLSICVTLEDGSKVVVRGESDGVNGYTWDADHDDVTVGVSVTETVLVDGETDIEGELDELRERGTCGGCLARCYRGEECVCPGDEGDAEDVADEFDELMSKQRMGHG